jgi:hypothetical protein
MGASGAFPGVEGGYRGLEAVPEWMELIRAEWEDFEVKLDEVLYDGDDVLVVAELLRGQSRRPPLWTRSAAASARACLWSRWPLGSA